MKRLRARRERWHQTEDISLIDISEFYEADVETMLFDIYVKSLQKVVGRCEFRLETDPRELDYYGNIGYVIYLPYRGHHYAYLACLKLLDIIRIHYKDVQEVKITCNPDNIASKKTIEKLKGQYLYTVDIDKDHELRTFNETQKEVYLLKLYE